ncbi:Mitogen-activated protein kinase [Actinidia chinensis var. chinensis]|uniref:Mitogen-activated protein kinase n=1 Tax=Actinidia chinensis var. chinensis TaxID=1590841 RepID=A0A2R6QXC9_ACTCC|nr:Mitogen-activated protein kinase [Actinidia chinensis var. chinensis]
MQQDHRKKNSTEMDFFSEYGDANRYKIQEVIGKGSYGVVCSAIDTHTGEKVAIKKIHDIFEHISDAARILREIKLLRLLRHPDIVEIKHIMLPPSRRDFRDIYVVFELMESDLHQVIKANDDLTREHYQFFLYQLLRALKIMLLQDGIELQNCVDHSSQSAVDQFRKQFAHLEESAGKNGPAIPLDRKHASLPRSSIVHSNTIPPKEQTNVATYRDRQISEQSSSRNSRDAEHVPGNILRSSQAPQRIPLAKPGRVVGPVVSYENGNVVKETYDPRTGTRNAVLPSQAIPPAYCYRRTVPGKPERTTTETERNLSLQAKQVPPCGMASKLAPDIAINIDNNPFYMTRAGVTTVDYVDDRITMDTKLLQAKTQYGGIGATAATASAAAHQKVGTVQYGLSSMY